MKLMQQSSRRVAFAIAFGLSAAAGSGAASRALAFDDKPTWTSVMELVGVGTDEKREPIDYRERSKLVVPPNRTSLPEPRAGEERSRNWLLGGSSAARPVATAAPAPAPVITEPLEKALAGKNDDSDSECSGSKRQDCWAIVPGRGWIPPASRVGATNTPAQTSRKHLIQPPEAYTTPTKTVSAGGESDASSSWNPFSLIGKAGKMFSGGQ